MTTQDTASKRIRAFVDWFLRSEHMREFGSTSGDWINDPERMQRCHDAAEFGGDGSTHAERIDDMRDSFRDWVRYGRQNRNTMSAGYERFETAVLEYFDTLERWHEINGSLDEQIG
jgi:hypothetical protein